MKTCTKCKQTNKEFNKNQKYCKDCQREYKKKYRAENKEKLNQIERERMREKRKSKTFTELENAKRRTEEYKKKAKIYAQNRDPKKVREWGLKATHKRLAAKSKTKADLTEEEWKRILIHFNQECAYCGAKEKIEREHIKPLSEGGPYTIGNILPACEFMQLQQASEGVVPLVYTEGFFSDLMSEKDKGIP